MKVSMTQSQVTIRAEDIKDIVEIAVDDEIPNFTMEGNWYEDYGMDSLGAIALVVEVTKRYNVRLPDDLMPSLRTGNDLIAAITKLQDSE